MFRFFLLFLCFFLTPCGKLHAHDLLLRETLNRYAAMETMQTSFTLEITNELFSSAPLERYRGLLYYQKPASIRFELTEPRDKKELTINSETVAWSVDYAEEAAFKLPSGFIWGSFLRVLTGQLHLLEEFSLVKRESDGALEKFEMARTSQGTDDEVMECIYWINPADKLIKKVQTISFERVKRVVIFDDPALDRELDQKLFYFSPPRGTEVFDRTRE